METDENHSVPTDRPLIFKKDQSQSPSRDLGQGQLDKPLEVSSQREDRADVNQIQPKLDKSARFVIRPSADFQFVLEPSDDGESIKLKAQSENDDENQQWEMFQGQIRNVARDLFLDAEFKWITTVKLEDQEPWNEK